MSNQNLYAPFHPPGDAAVKHLKAQLGIQLLSKVRTLREQGVENENICSKLGWSDENLQKLIDGEFQQMMLADFVMALALLGFDTVIELVPNESM